MQFVLDKMEILSCLWFFNATKQSFKKYLFLILISHGFLWLYRCQTDNSYFFLNVCCLKFCFLAKKKNSLFFPHLNMLKYTQDLYWEKKKKSNKTSIRKKKSNPVQAKWIRSVLWYANGCICKCSLLLVEATAASIDDGTEHQNQRHMIQCFLCLHTFVFLLSAQSTLILQAVMRRGKIIAGCEVSGTSPVYLGIIQKGLDPVNEQRMRNTIIVENKQAKTQSKCFHASFFSAVNSLLNFLRFLKVKIYIVCEAVCEFWVVNVVTINKLMKVQYWDGTTMFIS